MSKPTISVAAAKVAMADYIKQKNAKAKIDKKQKDALACLKEFAAQHPDKFDEEGNYKLPGGYLHKGEETVIVPCEGFNLVEFVKSFPELVDRKFKTAAIKSMLASEEGKQKFTDNHCVELQTEPTFTVVVK